MTTGRDLAILSEVASWTRFGGVIEENVKKTP
jgi:hypothetical protein